MGKRYHLYSDKNRLHHIHFFKSHTMALNFVMNVGGMHFWNFVMLCLPLLYVPTLFQYANLIQFLHLYFSTMMLTRY